MNTRVFILLALAPCFVFAQRIEKAEDLTPELKQDWHNMDYTINNVYGVGTNRTHAELIAGKAPKRKVVVAVIDSGVETDHEDLQGSIWINADEIAGNGIDDDKNGYVDDVHGWNFLVDDQGNDIHHENLEATRILRLSKQLKESNAPYPAWLTNDLITRAVDVYNKNVEEYKVYQQLGGFINGVDSLMKKETGKDDYDYDDIARLTSTSDEVKNIQGVFQNLSKLGITMSEMREIAEMVNKFEKYHLNYDYVTREEPKPGQRHYGNNHYEGPFADHGTHVAGIIAANSQNGGARGVASGCVEIMVLRAVPDGDEHDIDVANAIRYAADNGAQLINMSFGKALSPFKPEVDDAIRYAGDRGVLLIHGAGNDSEDCDKTNNYPDPKFMDGTIAGNFINVGATSSSTSKALTASFSNYGKTSVDIFAPGVDIYSTTPDGKYEEFSGTSMASPVVCGVAALVWAYHPELTALQLKQILLESVTPLPAKKVLLPGGKKGKEKVKFGALSRTGGIVNAHEAFSKASASSIGMN